jgi:HAMP domain-containing protein
MADMNGDIVERLRATELFYSEIAFGNLEWCRSRLPSDAADEIERLRGEVERLQDELKGPGD